MTYKWIWTVTCERHQFHSDHYKRSIVITATRAHMRQCHCLDISPDDILRVEAPSDNEY